MYYLSLKISDKLRSKNYFNYEGDDMTDEKIRELAEAAGFWSTTYIWWVENIPRLRRFMELANDERYKAVQEAFKMEHDL